MDYSSTALYNDQDIQVLQFQERPLDFSEEVYSRDFLNMQAAVLLGYQMECYENSLKSALKEIQVTPAELEIETSEPILDKKELKNLNTWRSNVKHGDFVEGTKIFPCKTFLCEDKWLQSMPASEYYVLPELTAHLASRGLRIGLILDLNRTTTYYNFEKMKEQNHLLSDTRYKKFKLENGTLPCPKAVDEVCELLKDAQDKGEVVVIHCFNGINRTGFMVCEFLCRFLGLSGDQAIERFEKARLHDMEHECMTTDLKRRYPSHE